MPVLINPGGEKSKTTINPKNPLAALSLWNAKIGFRSDPECGVDTCDPGPREIINVLDSPLDQSVEIVSKSSGVLPVWLGDYLNLYARRRKGRVLPLHPVGKARKHGASADLIQAI